MQASSLKPSTTIAPTVFSPHRKASIHRMRDRYRSQLLNNQRKQQIKPEEENLTEEDQQQPSTTTHRTDLPTKRRRLPSKPAAASESVKKYKSPQTHQKSNEKGQLILKLEANHSYLRIVG